MRSWVLSFALLFSASLSAAEATKQYVSLDGTRLLSKPAAFAKANGTLKKGTTVWADAAKSGYVKVKVEGGSLDGKTGYLSVRALQKSKPKLLSSAKKSGDASAQEVAAATKGFSKQVEADLRKEGGSGDGYDKLDQLIARTAVEDPASATETFREEGQLGEFQKGAQ